MMCQRGFLAGEEKKKKKSAGQQCDVHLLEGKSRLILVQWQINSRDTRLVPSEESGSIQVDC